MENAQNLFDKMDLVYIKDEMVGKEFENNWLECKQKSNASHGSLDEKDKSNFAKALSGFANTAGGVLAFGIEAKKEEDVDIIVSIKPITGLKRFESALRELESRIVERTVLGVEYKSILTGNDEGILLVLIPESQRLPHRAVDTQRFYIRAGGAFGHADLNTVQDLFSRRLKPDLGLFVLRVGTQFTVYLKNTGEATAKDPYVAVQLPKQASPDGYELNGNDRLASWVYVNAFSGEQGAFWVFQNGSSHPIHPHAEVPLLRLRSSVEIKSPVTFKFFLYAENMKPVVGTYSCE